jgi:hypothetical protein
MANNTLVASDTFQRANGGLGANWTTITGLTNPQIVSNQVQPSATGVNCSARYSGTAFPNDQVSEITIGTGFVSEASTFVFLQVRVAAGADTCYQANIGNVGQLAVYSVVAGTPTQLGATVTGLTIAAGDIWSMQAVGACITVYQNFVLRFFWVSTTVAAGSPGFGCQTPTTLAHSAVASWRGYNAIQQDGVWQKQGIAFLPISTDINTGVANTNSGTANLARVLHEGNAQVLSGTVYKAWFGTAGGIGYAESTDAINWTRRGGYVLAAAQFPQVFKNGNTYYHYVQPSNVAAGQGSIACYTSTDGVTWTLQNSTVISLGTAGQWDAGAIYLFTPVYIDGGGTWWAVYSGVNASNAFAMGLATSSDGIHWTKYVSNPVALSVWASVPYLIGGTWYMMAEGVPPGVDTTPDPTQGMLVTSTDLINWTPAANRSVVLHNMQLCEGVNAGVGSTTKGFAYPDFLMQVGSQTFMWYDGGPSNTASNTGSSWQINLAIANAPLTTVLGNPQNALAQVASDSFASGPGSLPGTWTKPTWSPNALTIVSGPFVQATTLSANNVGVYTGTSFGNDQYCQVKLQTGFTSGSTLALLLRSNTGATQTSYQCNIGGTAGRSLNSIQIYGVVAGVVTTFFTNGAICPYTPVAGDIFTFSVIGNVLSLYQNGWLLAQVVDVKNSIASGSPGVLMNPITNVNTTQIASFAAGNANVLPAAYSGMANSLMMMGVGT